MVAWLMGRQFWKCGSTPADSPGNPLELSRPTPKRLSTFQSCSRSSCMATFVAPTLLEREDGIEAGAAEVLLVLDALVADLMNPGWCR